MSLADPARPFGLQDLLDAPGDGYWYEVIDGAMVVNPAPAWRHQDIVVNLVVILRESAPEPVMVLPNPVWRIGPDQIPEPDIVVVDRSGLGEIVVEGTPLLVVEVLSPSNRGADLVRKRALYAEAGCPNYWIVDPAGPTVTVLRLDADGYHESVVAEGDTEIVVDQPFPIGVRPAEL